MQGLWSILLSVTGHHPTQGKGHGPTVRHPRMRTTEHTQQEEPLEGPWASRMGLTWFGELNALHFPLQTQTGDLFRSVKPQGSAPVPPAAQPLVVTLPRSGHG